VKCHRGHTVDTWLTSCCQRPIITLIPDGEAVWFVKRMFEKWICDHVIGYKIGTVPLSVTDGCECRCVRDQLISDI